MQGPQISLISLLLLLREKPAPRWRPWRKDIVPVSALGCPLSCRRSRYGPLLSDKRLAKNHVHDERALIARLPARSLHQNETDRALTLGLPPFVGRLLLLLSAQAAAEAGRLSVLTSWLLPIGTYSERLLGGKGESWTAGCVWRSENTTAVPESTSTKRSVLLVKLRLSERLAPLPQPCPPARPLLLLNYCG